MEKHRIDWPSFAACAAIIVAVCVTLLVAPESAGAVLQSTYSYIANEFGILYLLASVAAIGFLIWLASSRYGRGQTW